LSYSTPENLLLHDELSVFIYASIDKLPEDIKTSITLLELEGMTYEQNDAVKDCPVGTVRASIFRAREAK
ncbi:sigma factor-like helix-turn-helix DNA-binding protein, partial [Pseudoalteromonas ruthenica]|uniref:sigma factor-like helix-turn-helix DNA-binding protein n=1 Tax=Pseudoalteromonas ruthenica TaxID=151081 RepID=UPI00126AF554